MKIGVFYQDSVLLMHDSNSNESVYRLPATQELQQIHINVEECLCDCTTHSTEPLGGCILNNPIPQNLGKDFLVVTRREAAKHLSEAATQQMYRTFHLTYWNSVTAYCEVCGAVMEFVHDEFAKQCRGCNKRKYPRITPAIITAVVKNDALLLAKPVRQGHSNYSVIAGYVEPGESLEETVAREVQEEANIRVKNIRYFASQPWPYPDTLMIGFTAEYAEGELQADATEITQLAWFTRQNIPQEMPSKESLSRKLIDWFVYNKSTCYYS